MHQACHALVPESPTPSVNARTLDKELAGDMRHGPAIPDESLDEQCPPVDGQTGVNVDTGTSWWIAELDSSTKPEVPPVLNSTCHQRHGQVHLVGRRPGHPSRPARRPPPAEGRPHRLDDVRAHRGGRCGRDRGGHEVGASFAR